MLKDVIAHDIDAVFFKDSDFAEWAIIDGREVLIVKDDDIFNIQTDVQALGVSLGEEAFFIRKNDLKRIPNIDDQITINGKQYYVRSTNDNFGVIRISISRQRLYD